MAKILNLYAGIGGNRKLWKDVEVTAVEHNPDIAKIYSDFYPEDNVIIGDAHDYLLHHYNEYDFIWSSPPCQTHSGIRQHIYVGARGGTPKYVDMTLWQEIIFLKYNAKCKWVVENVKPYYQPPVHSIKLQRHSFWSNFDIDNKIDFPHDNIHKSTIGDLQEHHGINLSEYKIKNKRQILRNCIYPPLGLHVLNEGLKSNGN